MRLNFFKNVLQGHTEEIVCKTAVGIVMCQIPIPVTKRLACVMAVVKRDGSLLCVLKVLVIAFLLSQLFLKKVRVQDKV